VEKDSGSRFEGAILSRITDSGPTQSTGEAPAIASIGTAGVPMPTREELEFRAFKVEQQANKELRNLLAVLDLSDEEQDRVFAALAHRSNYFHPSLQLQNVSGGEIPAPTAPGTPQNPSTPPEGGLLASNDKSANPLETVDPVIDALPPDLVPKYREYKSDREQFWAGVVEKIESQLEQADASQ
jgi:hypothetical protein